MLQSLGEPGREILLRDVGRSLPDAVLGVQSPLVGIDGVHVEVQPPLNVAEGHAASAELAEGVSEIVVKVTGPVTTLRTLGSGDVAPIADADGGGEGESILTLYPGHSIDGLTVEYTPARVTVRIK